ncbi:MmgE/PrpD family protein [Vulcanisaeta thermophila]|uniref:MmgE/PrpD family protein n=1 Tax=Vulcanisaeta thermophila TaxID=867917 RepID=UPI00085381EF|nr:MmgE/PrpD family protein [Vulcanisaeta thermophila]
MVRDSLGEVIVDYALNVRFEDLSNEVIHEVKRRVLDSIGVALAAYSAEPVKIARSLAKAYRSTYEATLWGTIDMAPLDWASFTNSLMVRYLDYNDTYLGLEPLHPSDMIPTLMAATEYRGLSGRDLITAIAVSYEVGVRLCDSGSLRLHGWDHVNYISIAVTAGLARLMGLSREQALNALSIATVPHAAMRQSRVGELSHWKAAATANSSRNAVFAVLLAREGFTGPDAPLRGEMGFIRQLLSGEFNDKLIMELSSKPNPRRILDTYIKPYPVEYHAQSAVDAARQIRAEYGRPIEPDDVEYIVIDTFKAAYDIIVKDPEKWDPRTKETADHSLMWVTATALIHGTVALDHYKPEGIRDPRVLALIRKTKVNVDPELNKLYPSAIPNRVTVKFRDGREITARVDHPRGHPKNPMSDDELKEKFRALVSGVLTQSQISTIMDMVFNLENLRDIKPILKAMVV